MSAAALPSPAKSRRPPCRARALIVGDDASDLRDAAKTLAECGTPVQILAQGADLAGLDPLATTFCVSAAQSVRDLSGVIERARDASVTLPIRVVVLSRHTVLSDWQDLFRAGAHDVLPAPVDASLLLQVLNGARTGRNPREAVRAYVSSHRSAVGRMCHGVFEIRTLEEAERLSTMLASHCPNPETAAMGIWELLSNAIEHGNLEIDFRQKAELLLCGQFQQEVHDRLNTPHFGLRVVRVEFKRTARTVRIRATDAGAGFDYRTLSTDPLDTVSPNGRGIFLARTISFDKVIYRGAGNIVDAIIRTSARPARPADAIGQPR